MIRGQLHPNDAKSSEKLGPNAVFLHVLFCAVCGNPVYVAGGSVPAPARFLRILRHAFTKNQPPGTITINHGITATTAVLTAATLSDSTEAESPTASPICLHPLTPAAVLSAP